MFNDAGSERNNYDNEQKRLAKISHYEIVATAAESSFDQITFLIKDLFDVENAFIAFKLADEVFFKSWFGAEPLKKVITDLLLKDFSTDQYLESDLVVAAIQSPEGYLLGYVGCFLKHHVKPGSKQLEMLTRLSAIITDKLEERMAVRKLLRITDDRLHVLIHDLKNPMTTIGLQSELLSKLPGADEKVKLIAGKLHNQSKQIVSDLNHILSSAKRENANFKPQKISFDLIELLNETLKNLSEKAALKKQVFLFEPGVPISIIGDPEKLFEVFHQLIDNAIKFSAPEKEIRLSLTAGINQVTVQIHDQGTELSEEGLEKLFFKFADVGSVPTNHENTSKLGLQIVKLLVDMHKGKVWAERAGGQSGTILYVQLPLK